MRVVSRSEFARLAGVSPAAVTKSCKRGQLRAASQGQRVDLDHPAAVAYLEDKGVDATAVGHEPAKAAMERKAARPRTAEKRASDELKKPARSRPPAKPKELADGSIALPREVSWEDVERFADRSLRELARMFGTAPTFKDWLDALKKIEDTREKRLKNQETSGQLVEREFVQIHVFGALRAMTRRLLRDAPKTLAKEIYSMALAGRPIEDAEKAIRDGIGSQIMETKTKAARALGGEGPEQDG